jgi:hypothetical protein
MGMFSVFQNFVSPPTLARFDFSIVNHPTVVLMVVRFFEHLPA